VNAQARARLAAETALTDWLSRTSWLAELTKHDDQGTYGHPFDNLQSIDPHTFYGKLVACAADDLPAELQLPRPPDPDETWEAYVVVASNGGAEEDPAWFVNLEADPSVGVQVGTRRFTARARAASSAERAPLWAQMVNIFPLYDDYAQKTDREIPIVLLTPLDGPR
jgi:deazaflavin-dependent oxidoreductase (nitroreductase family)